MPFFDRFNRRWASTGVIAEPTASQADTGFAHLGPNPPTVEEFNAIHQWLDDKDNWLYGQIVGVLTKAGATPTAGNLNALRDALLSLARGQSFVVTATQAVVVPTWSTRCEVAGLWGGGGGGGGAGTNAAGGGGAGGGFASGTVTVTPGASILATIGQGGAGGNAGGGNGQAGGTTSLGSLIAATGGSGGGGAASGYGAGATTPGLGTGGSVQAPGQAGQRAYAQRDPLNSDGVVFVGGPGGASVWGGPTHSSYGASAWGAWWYGGGGAGGAGGAAGGMGAAGYIMGKWLP